MLNPLFFNRLLFFVGWAAFGAFWPAHGFTALLLALLSSGAHIARRVLVLAYGPAAEPLVPAAVSRGLAQLATVPARVRATLHQLPTGTRALLNGVLAVTVFMLLPPLVRLAYPRFGGFPPDTINAYTLGAMQFFLALTIAYVAWRWLFPTLYAYALETLEGKLLEAVTSELQADLRRLTLRIGGPYHSDYYTAQLAALAERRKSLTLTFFIRCARFVFSISPFFLFFWQANAALTAALTVVP